MDTEAIIPKTQPPRPRVCTEIPVGDGVCPFLHVLVFPLHIGWDDLFKEGKKKRVRKDENLESLCFLVGGGSKKVVAKVQMTFEKMLDLLKAIFY